MVLEAFGTYKKSEKGNSGMLFLPATLVTDSMFPFGSDTLSSKVIIRIVEKQLVVRVEAPVKLSVLKPKSSRTEREFRDLTELYEFLQPQFANKMWTSILPSMFFALAKDGHFAATTVHANVEASNLLHQSFRALRAAEETGFTRPLGLREYEVAADIEVIGRFVKKFDELVR